MDHLRIVFVDFHWTGHPVLTPDDPVEVVVTVDPHDTRAMIFERVLDDFPWTEDIRDPLIFIYHDRPLPPASDTVAA